MALTAFADNPEMLMGFCYRWGIQNPFTRAITVTCAGCARLLPLAFCTDVVVEDRDAKVYLIFELFARGWVIDSGKPYCPGCGH